MTMGGLSLLIDGVLILVLGVVALYAMRLHRSLAALRNAKDEMANLLATYSKATEKAEIAIARLKGAASDESRAVRDVVERGEGIKADLEFMIQRAGQIADRLDEGIRRGRESAPQPYRREEEAPPRRSAEALAEAFLERIGGGEGGARRPAPQPGGLNAPRRERDREEKDTPRGGRLRLGVPGEAEADGASDGAKKDLLRALQALR